MDRKTKGLVGESKVMCWFIENGYEVFLPFAECGPVDMVVIKDHQTFRVSIKFTSTKENQKWRVGLSTSYRKTTGKTATNLFDKTKVDLLAVYIAPEDRVVILDAMGISAKSALAVA